jgi:hypothetical protein
MADAMAKKRSTAAIKAGGSEAGLALCKEAVGELKLDTLSSEQKESAAKMLAVLAVEEEYAKMLVAEGCVGALVALLNTGNDGARTAAAHALAVLASFAAHRPALSKAGALAPLVALLRAGSNKAALEAASALASLCAEAEQRQPVIRAGALPSVVRLLRTGTADAQVRTRRTHTAHAHGARPLHIGVTVRAVRAPHSRASV